MSSLSRNTSTSIPYSWTPVNCRFAPIKKLSVYSVAIENPYEPNSLPETQPADGVHPWLKNQSDFRGFKVI